MSLRRGKLSAIVRPDHIRCITKAEERAQHKVHILCLADSFRAPSFVLTMWGEYRLLFFCAALSMAIGPFGRVGCGDSILTNAIAFFNTLCSHINCNAARRKTCLSALMLTAATFMSIINDVLL